MYKIALIGGGGVGKSTLAYSFTRYLNKQGIRAKAANFDPGAKHLKYEPAFDLRKHYSLAKTMRVHKLGSSGAVKKIYLSLAENKRVLRAINEVDCDWLFLDTVGSLELFFLEGVSSFLKKTSDAVLFLVDNECVENESDFLLLKAINAIQRLKYALPTLLVVNKSDLLEKRFEKQVLKQKQKAIGLSAFGAGAGKPSGALGAVDEHLIELLKEASRDQRLVFVSAWERTGLQELFDALNELKCECGEF